MIEAYMAWILLIPALFSGEASWYIASGVFAIAAQINHIADKNKGA